MKNWNLGLNIEHATVERLFWKSRPDQHFKIFGPVRSFVGTVRTDIFHFYGNLEWTLYFFNFSKFWSGPRTGPKKNPPRYGFFRTKIRTTDRTRFESGPNSGPRTGPTNLGPKIRTTYQNPDRSGFSVRSGRPWSMSLSEPISWTDMSIQFPVYCSVIYHRIQFLAYVLPALFLEQSIADIDLKYFIPEKRRVLF